MSDEPTIHVRTTLQARGPAAAAVLSDEQVAALGAGRSPAVRITVGGRTAEGRITRRGEENLLGLSRERRGQLGVEAGDEVELEIRVLTGPPTLDLPPELAAALETDAAARAAFDALAPSHRKELARSVADAKRPETRARRLEAALDRLVPPEAGAR